MFVSSSASRMDGLPLQTGNLSPSPNFALAALPTLTCLMSITNPKLDRNGLKSYSGFQVLSISNISSNADLFGTQGKVLSHLFTSSNLFDFMSEGKNGPTEVLICPEQAGTVKSMLSTFNIPFAVKSENYQKDIDAHSRDNENAQAQATATMNWKAYQRFSTIQNWMDSMSKQYPDIVSVETFGKSTEGRAMRALKISATGGDGTKPVVWLDSGIHAREWISVGTVTFMANEIIKRAVGGDSSDIINSVDWVIVPNQNPDGYEFTFTGDRLWRKTRSRTSNRRCFGTDPNRNWDFKWGGKGTSSNPCEEIYRGPRAASEPEVAATQKYIYSIKDQIKLFISFHSYSQLLFYPWAYDDVPIDDKEDLEKVANEGAAALEAVHGTQFTVGTAPQLIYPAAGGSFDWAKGVAKIKFAFTFELRDKGDKKFLLPPNEIIPSGEETFAGVTAMVRSVLDYYKEQN